jgi:hypothetical protein
MEDGDGNGSMNDAVSTLNKYEGMTFGGVPEVRASSPGFTGSTLEPLDID